jgi:hypothetical protein
MKSIRTFLFAFAAVVVLAATADNAQAFGRKTIAPPKYGTAAGALGANQQPLPVFQAAPWYLYWPYDGHFLTPAPVQGAFYGPPGPGNFPVNPYFPGPMLGGYGPIPGGAPPAGPYQR